MTDTRPPATASDRTQQSAGGLHVPEPRSDAEALLLKIGLILPLVGLALVIVAWYQTSGTAYVAEQIPMLISGGLLGLGLAIIGLGLFIRFSIARLLRFWMARLVVEQQAQTDRVVAALDRVERAIADKR